MANFFLSPHREKEFSHSLKPAFSIISDSQLHFVPTTNLMKTRKNPTAWNFMLWSLSENREALIPLLFHTDRRIREKASSILDRIDPLWPKSDDIRKFVPGLDAAMREGEAKEREVAKEALKRIYPLAISLKHSGKDLKWLKSEEASRQVPEYIARLKADVGNYSAMAAEALGAIGDERAVEPLGDALGSENLNISSSAARALVTHDDCRVVKYLMSGVKKALFSGRPLSAVSSIRALAMIGDYRILKMLMDFKTRDFALPALVKEELRLALLNIRHANKPFMKDYPYLYCCECRRRAIPVKTMRPFFVGNFVVCPSCQRFKNLAKGVKKAVGVIGDLRIAKPESGTLLVQLWDEQKKQACRADVDSIFIRSRGIENYHFAVNSVIIELAGNSPLSGGKIPISVEKNTPLTNDVKRMLEDFGDIQ